MSKPENYLNCIFVASCIALYFSPRIGFQTTWHGVLTGAVRHSAYSISLEHRHSRINDHSDKYSIFRTLWLTFISFGISTAKYDSLASMKS